jgi:uncharacterized membrane protein (DUF485 family)
MTFILAVFLAVFWAGVVLMIMSAMGFLAIPITSIFIPWIVILGIGITVFVIIIRRISLYDDLEQFHTLERKFREDSEKKQQE